MSRTGVIVALLFTVALAVLALLVLRSPTEASAPAGPLLKFEPAALSQIQIARPGGQIERARRIAGGGWVIELPHQPPWPANPERVRAAIRILSTLEASRPAERNDEPGGTAAEVRLLLDGGEHRTMRIAPRSIGGAVLVSIGDDGSRRAAWVDAAIAEMLIATGLAPWRDAGAMGAIGPEVSRVRLQGTQGTLEIGRIRGRWGLISPIAEIAEAEAVGRLFSLIGQTRVVDFLDAGAPQSTGLDSPIATLILESEQRNPDDPAAVTTVMRTLQVGRTADVAGRTVFARLSGKSTTATKGGDEWSRTVTVDGKPLAEISTDPATYIARRAVQAARADIGAVRISTPGSPDRTFRRTLDGWARVENDQNIPASPDDLAGVRGLLDLIADRPADSVSLKTPENAVELVNVELQTIGGDPVAQLTVGTAKAAPIAMKKSEVWRLYTAPGGDRFLRWLLPQ